ncbi:DegV family protein [Desulfococcaceae bacterium HSG8]|nr:DegV family protein [Desulfococcaceae bacterium HSG8]
MAKGNDSKRVIMTDTACAPTDDLVKKYNLEVMGMRVLMDDKNYIDGKEIDHETYYSMIESVKDFNTNPPLVGEIKKRYEELRKKGYREVIAIHVSSKMSKLIETSNNARKLVTHPDVRIIDTENVSAGAFFIVEKIAELLHRGKTYEEVLALLPEIRESSFIQISLSTLKYLVKNKRIGRAQGLVGALLGMKPILGIDSEGYLSPVSKERGKAAVTERISDNAIRFLEKRPYNVKIYLAYGLEKNKKQVEAVFDVFIKKLEKLKISQYDVIRGRVWPTIASLSGPEVYGFGVYGEKNPID